MSKFINSCNGNIEFLTFDIISKSSFLRQCSVNAAHFRFVRSRGRTKEEKRRETPLEAVSLTEDADMNFVSPLSEARALGKGNALVSIIVKYSIQSSNQL